MNQNQPNMVNNGYPMPDQKQGFKLEIPQQDKNLFIAYIACAVLLAIGCFLPFATLKVGNYSMNYISYDGDIKDGVFVIALVAAAVFFLFKNKHLISLILQGLGTGLFAIDAIDLVKRIKEANQLTAILGDSYKMKLGIGFYLVLIAAVGGIVVIFLLWKKNKATQPVNQQPVANVMPGVQPAAPVQPQPVVQNNCPYCGTPRNNDSAFCGNCGAKYQ